MIQHSTTDQDRYDRAKQRVELVRGFYGHALVFSVVNIGLAAYNLVTMPNDLWFIPTIVGWGIGLVAHGVYVRSSGRFLGAAWEERKIREEMDKDQLRTG